MKIKLFLLLFLVSTLTSFGQGNYLDSVKNHRLERNLEMKDTVKSPLKKDEILKFESLHFFDANEKWRITADFKKAKKKSIITMPTSSGKIKEYKLLGYALFRCNDTSIQLSVYSPVLHPEYLFIPFTDLTSGNECYGGGRYLEVEMINKKQILLDFNFCYNPYCAYTTGYNCPIPPMENFVPIRIEAGEKLLWESH
ncbi:MAG: DUF1684 domain-containing protein [Flavobacteriales bacterium]|nr:DUF1684 domain-containing protein [Flavobacteriales bacterium]